MSKGNVKGQSTTVFIFVAVPEGNNHSCRDIVVIQPEPTGSDNTYTTC
jgi:hypothetical protein